ncbi:unnamed protein product, partial [Amoebophrya sp. A25]|eukprot:GSA25T00008929001.1
MEHELCHERVDQPIWAYRKALLESIQENQVTFVRGLPGTGKSTQIGQLLVDANPDYVRAVLATRTASTARNLARRVTAERGVRGSSSKDEDDGPRGPGSSDNHVVVRFVETLGDVFHLCRRGRRCTNASIGVDVDVEDKCDQAERPPTW